MSTPVPTDSTPEETRLRVVKEILAALAAEPDDNLSGLDLNPQRSPSRGNAALRCELVGQVGGRQMNILLVALLHAKRITTVKVALDGNNRRLNLGELTAAHLSWATDEQRALAGNFASKLYRRLVHLGLAEV